MAGLAQPRQVVTYVGAALRPQSLVVQGNPGALLAQLARFASEFEVERTKKLRVFHAFRGFGIRLPGHGHSTDTR